MEFHLHDTADEVASALGDAITSRTRELDACVVLLPAGSTPKPLYREWRYRAVDRPSPLGSAHLFQLDELVGVEPDDERSFQAFLAREVLDPLEHPLEKRHLLDGSSPRPEREIELHAQRLRELGGADVALLGLGANGHVAFNEPGSTLASGARVVDLTAPTRAAQREAFEGVPPKRGMTLGLSDLWAAGTVHLHVTGDAKRAILRRVVAEDPSPDLPASLLRDHADLHVWADAAAAVDLP